MRVFFFFLIPLFIILIVLLSSSDWQKQKQKNKTRVKWLCTVDCWVGRSTLKAMSLFIGRFGVRAVAQLVRGDLEGKGGGAAS